MELEDSSEKMYRTKNDQKEYSKKKLRGIVDIVKKYVAWLQLQLQEREERIRQKNYLKK